MSATPGSFSNPNLDTEEDFGIEEAFEITGISAAFLLIMIIIRFFCNAAIDIAVLQNVHSLKGYLSSIVPALMNPLYKWHPRTQSEGRRDNTPRRCRIGARQCRQPAFRQDEGGKVRNFVVHLDKQGKSHFHSRIERSSDRL
jgi:hypothetical protein